MPKVVDIEQRRAELAEAASRLIARAGIESATMREVAAEAGWTTGALTHYFSDKRELLLTTFQASLANRRSQRPTDADADPVRQLRASLGSQALPRSADGDSSAKPQMLTGFRDLELRTDEHHVASRNTHTRESTERAVRRCALKNVAPGARKHGIHERAAGR